ncbi:glycerate kinase [Gemella cuniculi]|uniref:glycerate kinase n=1 Tax=Gemella cuniculi TaxID=150240 RepID=UPI001FE10F92|nr:glycerate kinase [Gemella cuniculi]
MVAMNEFKGCLDSKELSKIISNKIKDINTDILVHREIIADGGDGFLDIFKNFSKKTFETINANNEKINAKYLVNFEKKEAVIEIAEIVGIKNLKKHQRNPYKASTEGLGILINSLLNKGIVHFIIGLGGSATNDCGIGMLSALGFKFYDKDNKLCSTGISDLKRIVKIDDTLKNLRSKEAKFTLICDVSNPLYGENGTTYIFSEQKGLLKKDFRKVDSYVEKFSNLVFEKYQKDYSKNKGSGAAGGLGFAFLSFFNAKLVGGSDFMINYLDLSNKIKNTDILITGEGKLDKQSFMGKAPIEIAKIAKKYNKKVVFLAGSIDDAEIEKLRYKRVIDASFSIQRGVITIDRALKKEVATRNLEKTVEQIISLLEFNYGK